MMISGLELVTFILLIITGLPIVILLCCIRIHILNGGKRSTSFHSHILYIPGKILQGLNIQKEFLNILILTDETFTLSQKLGNSYLVPQHHTPEHNPKE
jgi:hypothetical protein